MARRAYGRWLVAVATMGAAMTQMATLAAAPHPADGPKLVRVAPVSGQILAIYLEEGRIEPGRVEAYVPQPGDELRERGNNTYLAWQDGRIGMHKTRSLWRVVDGRLREVGTMIGGGRAVAIPSRFRGTRLTATSADQPASYRISSPDDPAYAQAGRPTAVHRKSVPKQSVDGGPMVDHAIYLVLPSPLKEGSTYRVEFTGVNTAEADATYVHRPSATRSEAVRVSQVGFTPDSPLKRAFLSVWLGSGGPHAFEASTFEVRDAASGEVHFTGPVRLAVPADRAEVFPGNKNHNGTPVYHLDFRGLNRPGEYVVYVPGVGVSYPFRIAADVWEAPLAASMHGLLVHRSGIALDRSFADMDRPRPMHPADGTIVYQTDVTMWEGESDAIRGSLTRLLGPTFDDSKLERLPEAWGGYMDAGDWDRRSQHLEATLDLMEVFEQFGDTLKQVKLRLPPEEAGNAIPDLLDEALWNVNFYRRLQRADGGVRGGVESTEHPRSGEVSWMESLLVGAFDVDPVTTYRYAAAAARAARLVGAYDAALAGELRGSAERAWRWGEANTEASVASVRGRNPNAANRMAGAVPAQRALAAVELLRLTRDKAYHAAFAESSTLLKGGDHGSQWLAVAAYAFADAALVDAAVQRRARDVVVQAAEASLRFQEGNAYGIAMRVNLPLMGWVGFFTTPETAIGPTLTRAYKLTGDRRYPAGAIGSAQFTLGANPRNLVMTTGVGHASVEGVLHVDSRNGGMPLPRGITVYGNFGPDRAPDWVNQWHLGPHMHPPAAQWPTSEFYVDLGPWPEMNEYTIHQSIGPAAAYWAFLHGAAAKAATGGQ